MKKYTVYVNVIAFLLDIVLRLFGNCRTQSIMNLTLSTYYMETNIYNRLSYQDLQ